MESSTRRRPLGMPRDEEAADGDEDTVSGSSGFSSSDEGAPSVGNATVVELLDDEDENASENSVEIVDAPPVTLAATEEEDENEEEDDDDLPVGLAGRESAQEAEKASRKRRRLCQKDEKPAKHSKPTVVIKPQPTECTVCYDPCTLTGRHRLVSLKCGHVFGKKCIDRWVQERKTCPNCNVAVRKADIRPLFTDHVAVVDNSGVADLNDKFEAEKSRRIQMETELSRAKLQLQLAQSEAERFKEEAKQWRQKVADLQCRMASERFSRSAPVVSTQSSQPPATQPSYHTPTKTDGSESQAFSPLSPTLSQPRTPNESSSGWNYRMLFQYPLQNARVFDISTSCSLLCVGEAFSPQSYGIVKLSTADSRHAVRIPAHQSPVRDLRLSVNEEFALSVAFDGKLVVTNLRSDSVALQYALPQTKRQGWSCSFSKSDPFAMYCGFFDGTVCKYDMRRSLAGGVPLATFTLPMRQPVHSIALCPAFGEREQLVAATFSGFGLWSPDAMALAGVDASPIQTSLFTPVPNCSSLSSMQAKPSRILATSRTQATATPAKHSIYDVRSIFNTIPLSPSSTLSGFRTPSVLSRAAIWEDSEANTKVASWDDEQKQVLVWDETSRQIESRVSLPRLGGRAGVAPVVDVQHRIATGGWQRASRAMLGVLAPQELVVYGSTG
ncbi:hypothetical protein Poli38472_003478 [Pythium oligandrum]|uniref:RING-type E3 ubiquitin transferase n=1 Tax=Pythium oligandrum TaxID=41045 RepID=A0A8K1FG87_PYTOL|nr:hypothetical protein Poli38472_003478 [Pythium oligandrum]|eukprot:TMW57553.1 hypothetical protein Poli38472_003478 [Pythium oligandrum]